MTTIKNSYLTAEIDEKGAQLCRLASGSSEYIYDDYNVWQKHAPVLFPFAGRLLNEKFSYQGKEYGPVQIHGFAPYAQYLPCDQTESSVRMRMIVSDEIKAIWPFDFEFSVLFELTDLTLAITYEVKNNGKDTMYYGMGSHPGFNVPLKDNLRFEDYYINFPQAGKVARNVMDENFLATGKQEPYPLDGTKLHLTHSIFDKDAIILSNTGFKAVIATDKDSEKIEVEYPDTQYCAVWHKIKMEVPFVCIEPWTSLPGVSGKITALEEKEDYNVLAGGSYKEHHLNITIIK